MGINPSVYTASTLNPVDNLTWYDAMLYCNARSKRDGWDTVYSYTSVTGTPGNGATNLVGLVQNLTRNGYRLPTEALWEYACRAGTRFTYYWSDSSSAIGTYAWVSQTTAHPVAAKLPNAWKLYDILGNGYEWCGDFYKAYTAAAQTDPTGAHRNKSELPRVDLSTFNHRSPLFQPPGRLSPVTVRTWPRPVLPPPRPERNRKAAWKQNAIVCEWNAARKKHGSFFYVPSSAPLTYVIRLRRFSDCTLLTGQCRPAFTTCCCLPATTPGNVFSGAYRAGRTLVKRIVCEVGKIFIAKSIEGPRSRAARTAITLDVPPSEQPATLLVPGLFVGRTLSGEFLSRM